ncbi:hexosyltransferase [Elysia marginata]|uniref:Hexosyltransferase n=1 Tax=Elysia marginata TaxID=1093978 RepID=A0AAV4IZ55_9GAST|nr:hexosyltransferase [Elysia marginata]
MSVVMSSSTTPVFRGFAQVIAFFILGSIFGHVLWTQIHPSIDPKFLDCREASTPARKAKEQAEAIRMKIANQHFRLGLLNSNDTGQESTFTRAGEDTDDHFLFIGIMTARKYLDTRAFASSQTWVPRVPGKVVYFLGEGEEYKGDLNVIQLQGIKENDYPPQKKSFAMVHYMAEHFAKDYEWLIRADDDVYMRVDELVKFLKSINTTTPRYLGQPGFGKAIEEGKLGLAGAFCMGGPGVIMSRDVVLGVAPGLRDCLGVTVTGHEDTELGRCITINTGVQCSTNYEMKELFYQNYAELDLPNSSFKKELGKDELRAINLHPVKEPSYMFRLDNFFNNATLQKMEAKTRALRHEMLAMNYLLGDSQLETKKGITGTVPKELLDSAAPMSEEDQMVHKDFFEDAITRRGELDVNLEHIELLPDKPSIFHRSDKAWELVRYKTLHSTNFETGKLQFAMDTRRRANLFLDMTRHLRQLPEFRRTQPLLANITYQRLTANRGAETILYLKKRSRDRKHYLQPLYLRKPLEREFVEFREADAFDEERGAEGKPIYMLMPLYQRSAIYRRFLEMYARVVTEYKGKVELRVVVFPDDRGEHKLISASTYSMIGSHPHLDIRMTYMDEPFNRGKGLMTALADLPYNSLLLFMDVDMEFSSGFLHRVSKYTVMGKSTFFPIYFVHFNPESICYKTDDCDQLLNSRADKVGLWRSFSYGIGSVYKRDLQKAGGFKTDIKGWGLEDVDFFEKCISLGLQVMRPSDPSMIHRYHPRECNTSLPLNQLVQCQDSGAAMLGSVKNLYHILDDVSNGEGIGS